MLHWSRSRTCFTDSLPQKTLLHCLSFYFPFLFSTSISFYQFPVTPIQCSFILIQFLVHCFPLVPLSVISGSLLFFLIHLLPFVVLIIPCPCIVPFPGFLSVPVFSFYLSFLWFTVFYFCLPFLFLVNCFLLTSDILVQLFHTFLASCLSYSLFIASVCDSFFSCMVQSVFI